MSRPHSALRSVSIAVLLIGIAGFVRGAWAQDVKPVTPEPLAREIESDGELEVELFAAPAERPENEGEVEDPPDGAVAREPLERDLDRAEGEAEAAGGGGLLGMLLGAFDRPAPAEAAEAVGGGLPANLRPFMPALNQALTIEIHYLRKVCNPDDKQLKQIRAAGEKKIRELAAIVARNRHQAFNDQEQGGRGPLLDALLAAAKEALPAEKYESYRKELEERKAARLRGACEMMTLHVDNTLSFPLGDYDQVVQLLIENSQPQWTSTMQVFLYSQYCPLPGIELIRPVLNDRQEKIWSNKQRRTSSISFGWPANFGLQQMGQNVELEELDDYSREVDDE